VIASMQLTVPCDPSLAQRANNSELAAHLGSQKANYDKWNEHAAELRIPPAEKHPLV
jgi:hypothetical protein